MKSFAFEISLCEVLSERAIWPDGDAPPNPTAEDVEALFFENPDVHATARKWGFEIRRGDVQITELEEPSSLTPFAERVTHVLERGFGASVTTRLAGGDFAGWLALEATFRFERGGGIVDAPVKALLRKVRSALDYDLLEFVAGVGGFLVVIEADPDLIGRLLFAEARRAFDAGKEASYGGGTLSGVPPA